MTTQNRPTISANRAREEIGTTVRGTGTALALTGVFLMVSGVVLPEPPMGGGLHNGLNIIGGGVMTLAGGAARYVGGLIMDRQGPQ